MRVFVILFMLLAITGAVFAAPVTNSSPKDQPVVVDKQNTTSIPANPAVKPVKTKAPVQPEICTKADCDSVQKLVTEFSGELKKMRVDVDALKKEVAALNDRVTVLKKNKFP